MKIKSISGILILLSLVFVFSGCKRKSWRPDPPFPGIEKAVTRFHIPANCDTTLYLPSGTSIAFSLETFVYPDGLPVSGSFEILYREFHDAVDIFLAGIPMDFYSMGQCRTMQTAGMFEIDAQQDGQKLMIAKGKNIDITFGSRYPGDNYSFFFLNPDGGKWEWVDMPVSIPNTDKIKAREVLAEKTPQLFMGDEFFVLNYNRFLDIYLNNDWVKIDKLIKDKGVRKKLEEYRVKFHDLYAEGEIVFGRAYYHPAEMLWKDVDGKPFPAWLSKFDAKWERGADGRWRIANYKISTNENNIYEIKYVVGSRVFTKKMEAVIPLKNLLKLPAADWQKRYDEAMKEVAEEQTRIDLMAETFRSFSVNRLGVFNFDVLLKLDDWFEVDPSFTINETESVSGIVIVILGDNSGYLSIEPGKLSGMRINPGSKHRILMMLPGNEIGYYPVDKLQEIDVELLAQKTKPAVTFNLQKHVVSDAIAFREFLGF